MGPLRTSGSNMGNADAIKYQIQVNFVMFFLSSMFGFGLLSSRPMDSMRR